MGGMTRGTREFCIGCGGILLSVLSVGCAQSRNGRTSSSAEPRQANVVTAAADIVNMAAGVATGAVTGAVDGAVAGANSGAQTTRQRTPRIKRNGRGGYDASELQQDALRRAHAMADRYGTIDRSRPTTQPTTVPANR